MASPCVPSPVSAIRTPKLPLLPVWEKGVGGMRGKGARECRTLLISPKNSTLARCGQGECLQGWGFGQAPAFLRSLRASGRPASPFSPCGQAHRGRFFWQAPACRLPFQPSGRPNSPFQPRVGEGGWGDEGQRRTGMQNVAHLSQKLYPCELGNPPVSRLSSATHRCTSVSDEPGLRAAKRTGNDAPRPLAVGHHHGFNSTTCAFTRYTTRSPIFVARSATRSR